MRQGHRRIGQLNAEETLCTSTHDRLAGYRQALHAHAIPFDSELAALRPYLGQPASARHALLAHWLALPNRPTAIVTLNAMVLRQLAADLLHLDVKPADIALKSLDDTVPDPAALALAVATAHLPSYEMGLEATKLGLDARGADPSRPARHVVLSVELSFGSHRDGELLNLATRGDPAVPRRRARLPAGAKHAERRAESEHARCT